MRNGQNNNKRMRNRNNGHNNNNNRRSQNPMTRVYDSNGPDIKIRGTAAHIAEKYLQLARDSQSSGDPVAAENYYQHAEHYFRLIAAAQEQFRQNLPQHQQPRIEPDLGDDDGEDFNNFGVEPGFVPQPQYQPPREQQPYQQHREQPTRDHSARERDPGFREQPREQPYRENRPQPQPAADAGDVDRLPSFITGAQPSAGFDGPHQEGGGRFPPRRRRRPHGPRPEGGRGPQPAPSEDFTPGE
jgi:hypothetical protein